MLSVVVDLASRAPSTVVLPVAALVLAVESGSVYGVVLPGATVAIGLGLWSVLAGHGLVAAMACAGLGTVAGAQLSWWRGVRAEVLPVPVTSVSRAARAVHPAGGRRGAQVGPPPGPGGAAIAAAGQWAGILRPLTPRLLAASGADYRWAGPALAVSGGVWGATLVGLGARLGPPVVAHLSWVGTGAGAVVVVLVATHLSRTALRGSRTASGGAGSRSGTEARARGHGRRAP